MASMLVSKIAHIFSKSCLTYFLSADFFTVACRTGKPDSGMSGLSLLLIEKSMKGVTPRQMKCSGIVSKT
jgi:alkylation response protein AidB-like acyl-CoA dehydrogenase